MGLFVQDDVRLGGRVTIQIGMRYEWHVTPTERDDRFIVFDARSASLLRVGRDVAEIYEQNNRNFEPRLGVAWDLKSDGRTVVRAAYARAVDQPGTTAVRDTAGNPPFAAPLTAAGSIALATAISATRPAGLAPATVDPQFRNASVQSWNVNLQRQLAAHLAVTVAYYGSHGTSLRISRNLNQPVNGVPPFPTLSTSSPIAPGTPLGVITQVESSGFSNYHAGWVSVSKRLSRGLQLETSYTLSKSLDTNSLNSSGFAVQNSYDIPGQYGLSDFAARHRFVLSATYALPFTGSVLTRGWQVASVVQAQSGNPVNIVTSNSRLTGVANSVRPDVTGPIGIIGSVDQWFDPSVFMAVDRFGNLGRNVVIGPAFNNTDVSLIKKANPVGRLDLQFSVAAFDVFNRAQQKQLSGFSRPFIFVVSFNYTTPKFSASNAGLRGVSWVARDWQIGGVLRYQSGSLIRVPASNNSFFNQLKRTDNPANWGGANTYYNPVAGQSRFLVDPNCKCFDPTRQLALNTAAWTDAAPGAYGVSAPYYNDYRWQRQPAESLSLTERRDRHYPWPKPAILEFLPSRSLPALSG
jgi:hypothetical protein